MRNFLFRIFDVIDRIIWQRYQRPATKEEKNK